MVLGLIALAGSIPMTATSVLSLQDKAENTKSSGIKAEWKEEKCHMRCRPTARTPNDWKDLFKDNQIVLRDGYLYVQLATYEGKPNHPFSGYYLPYPDSNFEGLVSTISLEPPQLNWIYFDTNNSRIRHGLRVEAEKGGNTGPWGARVIAVETEEVGLWSLCFDRYDDGLRGKVEAGRRTVELELIREDIKK
jgi:hypothetical protein